MATDLQPTTGGTSQAGSVYLALAGDQAPSSRATADPPSASAGEGRGGGGGDDVVEHLHNQTVGRHPAVLEDVETPLPGQVTVIEEVVNGEVMATRTLSAAEVRDTKDFWQQVEAGIEANDGAYTKDLDIKEMVEMRHMPYLKRKDKVYFLLGVCNALFLAYCAGGHPAILPYFYSIKFPLLIGLRFFYYKALKWQYFMLDFCYFANLTLLTYLWLANDVPELFMIVFGICNGPLAWAVVLFRNSLVFHSLDKITSAYIHITPLVLSYILRWQRAELWWPGYTVCETDSCTSPFLWLTVYSACCFAGHQALYWFLIKVVWPVPDDHDTIYRYLAGTPNDWAYKYVGFLGDRMRPVTFSVLYCIFAFVCMLPNYLWYWNQTAHFVFVIFQCVALVWNGANFYVEVFARGYKMSAERASPFMILAQ